MATFSKDEGNEDTSCIDNHVNGGGYSIVLGHKKVSILRRGQEISYVLLEDILGIETTLGKPRRVELTVHGFPKTKKLFRGETRWRVKLIHYFDSEDSTENETLAKQWKEKIIIHSRKFIQKKYNWYYEGKQLNYNCIVTAHRAHVNKS